MTNAFGGGYSTAVSRRSQIVEALGTTPDPTYGLAAFAVIPEMTATLTVAQGVDLNVDFAGSFELVDDDSWDFQLFLDGVPQAKTLRHLEFHASSGIAGLIAGSIDGVVVGSHAVLFNLSAGAHTIDVRWSVTAGQARANGTQRALYVAERL